MAHRVDLVQPEEGARDADERPSDVHPAPAITDGQTMERMSDVLDTADTDTRARASLDVDVEPDRAVVLDLRHTFNVNPVLEPNVSFSVVVFVTDLDVLEHVAGIRDAVIGFVQRDGGTRWRRDISDEAQVSNPCPNQHVPDFGSWACHAHRSSEDRLWSVN